MTAESLAYELGGRRYGRGWRAKCPAHSDRHPSLDITDRDDRVLFVCRTGCAQSSVIEALRDRGLWVAPKANARAPWNPGLRPAQAAEIPDCCLSGPCDHWRGFKRQYLVAHLLGNLDTAAREIVARYRAARIPVVETTLVEQLNFTVPFGAIAPCEIPADIVEKAVSHVARQFTEAL